MNHRRVKLLATLVIASCLLSLPARADILIESHRDRRPADADAVLAAFRAELATASVTVQAADVVAAAGDQLPLPGNADPRLRPDYTSELSRRVELGMKQVGHAEYAAGLATLEDVLARARANAAAVATDPSSQAWLTKAYAVMAFAQLRLQRPDAATETVTEQIRSFPEDPIGMIYGPVVATLSDRVRKTLDAAPHGDLRIVVTQPDVQIFVNDRLRGSGRSLATAVPGVYRLLLSRGGLSRRYSVRVVPNKSADLYVDWDADAAFRTTDGWIGFVWSLDQEDRIAAAVTRYARGSRQHDILVAGIVERSGHRILVGTLFEKRTGALLRSKAVVLDRDPAACQRALAQFLLTGSSNPCLGDLLPEHTALLAPLPTPTTKEGAKDPFVGPGLLATAGGIAVIGGVTLSISKQDRGTDSPAYFGWPGVSLLVGGGLAIGGAIYWIERLSDEHADTPGLRRSKAPIYLAAGTAAASFVAAGYLFHLDGRGTCGADSASDCPYRYAVAGPAWGMIAAGVAATGVGVYWYVSAPGTKRPTTLTLTPTDSGALASVRGNF